MHNSYNKARPADDAADDRCPDVAGPNDFVEIIGSDSETETDDEGGAAGPPAVAVELLGGIVLSTLISSCPTAVQSCITV